MVDTPISKLTAASALAGDEPVILSQRSATVTISAGTISALASDQSFNDSGSGFVAAGFAVGDYVNVSGFTGNTANNIFSAEITALTAGKMTIGGTDGTVIVDDAAGETVVISKWVSRRSAIGSLGSSSKYPRAVISESNVYLTNYSPNASFTTYILAANKLWLYPIFVSHSFIATQIAVQCTSNGTGNQRLGIYAPRSDADCRPGLLLVDAGVNAMSGATSMKSLTISLALTPGLYWVAASGDGGSGSVRGFAESSGSLGVAMTTSAPVLVGGLSRTLTYGALPADESAQSYSVETNCYLIGIR